MAELIIIRLHPIKPTTGSDFAKYLSKLTIKAFDKIFADPGQREIEKEVKYLPPPKSGKPEEPDPKTEIIQHFVYDTKNKKWAAKAAATAVIIVKPNQLQTEYKKSDLLLEIKRDGKEVSFQRVDYNALRTKKALPKLPKSTDFQGQPDAYAKALNTYYNKYINLPTSIYVALPDPGRELDPKTAQIQLPEDGLPPYFTNLKTAVEAVLKQDPGAGKYDLGALTQRQCRHIAYEIVWNRILDPLPAPSRPLQDIYTENPTVSDREMLKIVAARKQFEADLQLYYVKHNSEAERLANFVFSLSAAIWCQEKSKKATQARFSFPVLPSKSSKPQTEVLLTGVGGAALAPAFEVPAAYFYALTAILPPRTKREQRYKMTTMNAESQTVADIKQALDDQLLKEPAGVNHYQAARRLWSLGVAGSVGTTKCEVATGSNVHQLISDWLAFAGADINKFFGALSAKAKAGHLDLVLCAITKAYQPLVKEIKKASTAGTFKVKDVEDLAEKKTSDWETLLAKDPQAKEKAGALRPPDPSLLPDFTKPGTAEERFYAFIRHLRKFFAVESKYGSAEPQKIDKIPGLPRSPGDPLNALLKIYPGFTFANWNAAQLKNALDKIFPGDTIAREQFAKTLACIQRMINLTKGVTPDEIQFSVIEALWARGFTSTERIEEFSATEFKKALTGSIAYDHAQTIWKKANINEPGTVGSAQAFKPVNPDGSIVNCVPPQHQSPLGPVAYLHELIRVSKGSSCEDPLPEQPIRLDQSLAAKLAGRRGRLGDLLATKANLDVPLPLIDIVNESLEHMVATDTSSGAVYDTATDKVGNHELSPNPKPTAGAFLHDPETLFETLPEHSMPATPTAQQAAYDILKSDFSACNLPYLQPLDVSRTYLEQLGSNRFAAMQSFRKEITEFVLDPANETPEFQNHLWRHPVKIETAIEYLGLSPEEYDLLFQKDMSNAINPPQDQLVLYHLYGFAQKKDDGKEWTETIIQLSEFLERTCLTYCQFLELWKSKFVEFRWKDHAEEFPDCEPCCLDKYLIEFIDPTNPVREFKRLAVFIRLWRKLQTVPNAKYSFIELCAICEVLELYRGASLNLDFIRQLAAFQMFRDIFDLSLVDPQDAIPATNATGADRLHLLAFWQPGAPQKRWDWAVDHLLYQIQQYAVETYGREVREPEFIKLLRDNLDPLSALAGFNPNNPDDTWHEHPTHTLRFAEILDKIYASEFGVGELLFLFTNADHLQGDDPFPLQTTNEAKDSPLGLPDDQDQNSLWALRHKLLAVEPSAEDAEEWTWTRMGAVLREEFGFVPPVVNDRWLSLGQHFFPTVLADRNMPVSATQKQYRVPLKSKTSSRMWNTPPNGPFQFEEPPKEELWTQLPLTDEAVLAKLSRIRQLTADERTAVRALYFMPRLDLAHFAFIFNNFAEAEERLIQEPDESKRWAWFQMQFARFYQQSQVIADHLAAHVADATRTSNPGGSALAKLLLINLWADENIATTPWENDNGQPPPVIWPAQPAGGAYAALLGLTGTGMLAEYQDAAQILRWREVRGGVDAFGPEENAWNAPIPTILPAMDFSFSPQQLRFADVRNGFAMANKDGTMLGGAEPFVLRWKGLLLVENKGKYGFSAGMPTSKGELADFEKADQWHRWRITLKRGQKTWVLLAHDWPNEEAPADRAAPITLKKGFYELIVELERKPMLFDGPEDVYPQTTGFQLKYKGPDADNEWKAIPHDKLFQDYKDDTLQSGIQKLPDAVKDFLANHYTSTVRDMRRTYQRAYKALLLACRLNLSAQPISDDGQSELGYMLAKPANFSGYAYYRDGAGFATHKANFDPNFFPVLDNYHPSAVAQDQRVDPTLQRRQALFDWWERLFDYTVMRSETQRSPEQPVWLLFHEAAEAHVDKPAHLLRHMGVDLRHTALVLKYFEKTQATKSYDVTSPDLEDDRWAVRVWHAKKWVLALLQHFYPKDIRAAKLFLWASDGPTMDGNANLTQFYRDGCIENDEPRRYIEIKQLNDALRQRGRAALVAYLTHRNRVKLPWGGFATEAKHLSELLLIDVEAGLCQKASRIEEAITAIQLFVQRARLGLEPAFSVTPEFILVWDRHFATFRVWEACKRRLIYRANWVEWDDLQEAKQTEAFQFLESELRRAALTMPVPGGLTYWSGSRPPAHPGIALLQHREPSTIQLLDPAPEGLGLLGTPDRHARPSWLAPINIASARKPSEEEPDSSDSSGAPSAKGPQILLTDTHPQQLDLADLPMWLQAAVRLGTQFIRIAAAGIPPATTTFEPKCDQKEWSACCTICGKVHPAQIDEYYFWIEESRHYDETTQVAEWGAKSDDPQTDWHRPKKLPGLLHWPSEPMVHLRWCRVHNGEFQQPRQSHEGVRISDIAKSQLVFLGRSADSLHFEVKSGIAPEGIPAPIQAPTAGTAPSPGFHYSLASDAAIVVPQVMTPTDPNPVGGLVAFPYFAWFEPGAPLLPPLFSPAIAVAGHLRTHCRYEAALKWYELVYSPLLNDNTWVICPPEQGESVESTIPIPTIQAEACCCASDPVSEAKVRERAILMHYLDTLLEWGDALMRKNTPETFQQARLIFDTASKILGIAPITVMTEDTAAQAPKVSAFDPACAPINPRLLCLYTSVEDRLALIHACLNAWRLKIGRPNLDMPYFGNSEIRDCWKITSDICADEGDWCLPQSPYRFLVLVQRAQSVAGDVRNLGGALLAAYEKGDAEYLTNMRAMHERQLLDLTLEVRQDQWREADWQVKSLQKTKEIAQTRRRYYDLLIQNDLNSGELQYESHTDGSLDLRVAGRSLEATAEAVSWIPDINIGTVGPCPVILNQLPLGTKLGGIFATLARIMNSLGESSGINASLDLTQAGWTRREEEWRHQVEILDIEIEQIERQILAAERRRDIALRELNNQQQQLENAGEVHDFLRDKFTNHALYLWLQQETAAIYYQMYEMALHTARQAQRAFNFERGHTARQFIPAEIWDNLHEGLLAGERLNLALQHMEKAYYDENAREYELTKHISLRLHHPMAFLQLQTTGYCEIDLPEWMFDLDYPGQYMRRIKNVTMTIPCVVGPYTGVHCRLTLLSSKTRVDSRLVDPPHTCCKDEQWEEGYRATPDDPRIVSMYAATEAIATSSGQNDSGMFELNFRDERYLPFEFSGAVSRWRIELPLENNHFDMKSLSDVVLHLNFTAREGGENLRRVANVSAQQHLPGYGVRFFDVRKEFSEAWHSFVRPTSASSGAQELGIRMSREMFPYLTGNKQIGVNRLELLFEAPGADPSAHHVVEFLVGQRVGQQKDEKSDIDIHSIVCVADASWPGLFHGVLELDFDALPMSDYQDLGVFRFPQDVGEITDTYLFCGYKAL